MMKRVIFLILVLSTICFAESEAPAPKDSQWFPFILSLKLDNSSPANVGQLILDPPAGKHGFVKALESDFTFEDGTPARFWGTNLCFSSNFPSKDQAEMLADRLAFFGFNAVRLHHMDSRFSPSGIFEDTHPTVNDPQKKKTGKLSAGQLDKLDYLIHQLKIHGIYININLLVGRPFTLADGVRDAEKLKAAAKPVSMFDPKLIKLQKQYAHDLLTHYNPYTKLTYQDDPAVALVEIINESSLFRLKESDLPNYYREQLNQRWQNWSQGKKLPSRHEFYIDLQSQYLNEMISFLKNELKVKVPIAGIGGYLKWPDTKTLSPSDYIDKHAYWDHPKSKGYNKEVFSMKDRSMLQDSKLGIIHFLKQNEPNKKPYTISEWNHCYPNPYAYETPLLIAAEAVTNHWDALFQFAYDLQKTDGPAAISNFFNISDNAQQLLLCSIGSLLFLKEKQIQSSVQNGVFRLESNRVEGVSGFIKNSKFNLPHMIVNSQENGAVFLYSADAIPLAKTQKWILTVVGEIKNTGSGWNNQNKPYNWGGPPVLLKNMNAIVTLKGNKKFKIYELGPDAKRAGQPKIIEINQQISFSTKESATPFFEISSE